MTEQELEAARLKLLTEELRHARRYHDRCVEDFKRRRLSYHESRREMKYAKRRLVEAIGAIDQFQGCRP